MVSFFAKPWPLRGVPYMDNNHSVAIYAVVHPVGRASDPKGIEVTPIRPTSAVGIVLERAYSPNDSAYNCSRGLRIALIQVRKNSFALGECTRRIANFHAPCRLSAFATTSSATN